MTTFRHRKPPFFRNCGGKKFFPTLGGYTGRGILVKAKFRYFMAHTIDEKKRLLNRVRRIRGQVEAVERTLDQEAECSEVLHNISACRGAMDALMAEVIEGHIRFHVLDPKRKPTDEQTQAADDLIHALRAYLK
jgi:FrmR/RcnR family transcriptional regulator, repressor of frmRAB operon